MNLWGMILPKWLLKKDRTIEQFKSHHANWPDCKVCVSWINQEMGLMEEYANLKNDYDKVVIELEKANRG